LRTEILDIVLAILEKKRALDLERQVEELNTLSHRLQIASDAARQASQQKSEMISVVSHDLRAPLTSIKGALSLLKHGVYEKSKGEKLLSIAYTGCDYLLKLINDLLNLESIESGGIRLEAVEVSLREIIDQAFQLVSASSDAQGIRLEAMVDSVAVVADRERLLQVLVNLISNAIKFSAPKSSICVSAQSSDGATTIKVADQGRGIPFEFRKSIFQRFKQVEAEDRGEKGGVGLGLAICKTIVEAHGGTIGVDSEIGMGSTFWFSLPSRKFFSTAVKPASQDESNLRAELVVSEQKLSERTRERDDFELRLIESDHELVVAQSEFAETTRRYTATLANLTLNVSRVQTQLHESDANLSEQAKDFAASKMELKAILHERASFESALNDLRAPILRATQMLQYIAAGGVTAGRQVEILNQIIEANKGMLSGAEHIAKVAYELAQRTSQSAQRTAEIQESNAELKAIMQQREDFIAALTHDLQNPLIGATQILEMFAAGSFSERQNEQNKVLSLVIESNKSMLRMIRNMLDIYRQESGSLVPFIEAVDLLELLKKCLKDQSFNIGEKNLKLTLHTSGALQSIQTDSTLLRRVVSNLLDNGVKFSPEGGELTVFADSDEKQWRVSVTDAGPGMSEEQLEHIFQRFWQTKEGQRKGIGSGLGLFSSKMIMDALGGKIECSSNEKGGTTFTVTMQTPAVLDH
jgi:signal transduction histidine kinase